MSEQGESLTWQKCYVFIRKQKSRNINIQYAMKLEFSRGIFMGEKFFSSSEAHLWRYVLRQSGVSGASWDVFFDFRAERVGWKAICVRTLNWIASNSSRTCLSVIKSWKVLLRGGKVLVVFWRLNAGGKVEWESWASRIWKLGDWS
jgi:hypothetical protein